MREDATDPSVLRAIDGNDDYRLLRRLEVREGLSGVGERIGVALDVETTGVTDEEVVIEVAMRRILFDRRGVIAKIDRMYGWLEDPGRPIPPDVEKLTGITDEMVEDTVIQEKEALFLRRSAEFVVAHNARFDRGMVEACGREGGPVNGLTEPTVEDFARILIARAAARLTVSRIEDECLTEIWAVFRAELATCVRSASPVLERVLGFDRIDLDHVVWSMRPTRGWPFGYLSTDIETAEPHAAERHGTGPDRSRGMRGGRTPEHGDATVALGDGGRLRVLAVDQSLEMRGRLADVAISTRSGLVRLAVPGSLPPGLREAAIGKPVATVVDLAVLRGRDWPIVAVEEPWEDRGWTFVAHAPSTPFIMPWARSA